MRYIGMNKSDFILGIFAVCILQSIFGILVYNRWPRSYIDHDDLVQAMEYPMQHERTVETVSLRQRKSLHPAPKNRANYEKVFAALKPWQRHNHFRHTAEWDDKDKLADTMRKYYSESGIQPLHSFPETYLLHQPDDLERFRIRLLDGNGGMDIPWVLKQPTVNEGKGVTFLAPQSEELKNIATPSVSGQRNGTRRVVQNYICDEMTWEGRKFELRVFWAVASVDPLVVFFHTKQHLVRIGHAMYDEFNLQNTTTKDILTFSAGNLALQQRRATGDEFRELVEKHVFGNESQFRDRFYHIRQHEDPTTIHSASLIETIEAIVSDPVLHVQNQMKTIIGHLANAYKNITLHNRDMASENGFSLYAADMIIDNNLDVYILEGTDGPMKFEEYDFKVKMHDELHGSLVDIVEEVTLLQEKGRALNVSKMKEMGVLGGYEVVYNDGWFTDYRYQRLPKMGCNGTSSDNTSANNTRMHHSGALMPSPKITPASFTALPKETPETEMTYWTQGWKLEPPIRSFIRNGWRPANVPQDAQVIFHVQRYKDKLLPWQWLNQFPTQFSFFEGVHLQYLDYKYDAHKMKNQRQIKKYEHATVCHPIQHGSRRLEVVVYWLVLSLDPLTVLYHDGFVYLPYTTLDENEFIDLPKGDGKTEKIWNRSWRALEYYLANTKNFRNSEDVAPTNASSLKPTFHVRNQMKVSLVKLANGFSRYTEEQNLEQEGFSSFAIFSATFQVDHNLSVFAVDADYYQDIGEEHAEIVSLHDDLYGSTFRLLNYFNSSTSKDQFEDSAILGNYEWLIKPNATDPQSEPWNFHYEWDHKAKECFD